MDTISGLEELRKDIWSIEDNQLIQETIQAIKNRDKMIKYLQEEHKKRGEEILQLKDKLSHRNMQIRELKKEKKENEAMKEALAIMQTIPDWQLSPAWFQEFQKRTIEIINR